MRRVGRSFARGVARRLGAPVTMTCTTGSTLLGFGKTRGLAGQRGCLRVVRARLGRLDKLIRRVLSVDVRRQGGFHLGCRPIRLEPVLRGLVDRRELGTSGPARFGLVVRRGVALHTSHLRLCGVVDGLVSGTVGCSSRGTCVCVSTVHYGGPCGNSHGTCMVLGVRSGKVNVPTSERGRLFSGFCQIPANGLRGMGKCKLKLCCMGAVVRRRGKAISIRDDAKGNDAFALGVPRWTGKGSAHFVDEE